MDVQTILAFGSNKLGMDTPLSIPVRGCEPSWGNCRGSTHMQPEKDTAELFQDGFFFFKCSQRVRNGNGNGNIFMILTEIDVGWGPGHKTGQEAQSRQSSTWRRFLAKFSHVLLQM